MGFEKRFNSLCSRLRKRFGIKNSEEETSKFDSAPDLRKSARKSRKTMDKKRSKEEKEFGVSMARFDEGLDRDLSSDSQKMYYSQPQFEWVHTQNGYIEESGREFSPAWSTPKPNFSSLHDLKKSAVAQSPTPPPRRSKYLNGNNHQTTNYPNFAVNGKDLELKVKNSNTDERNFFGGAFNNNQNFEGLLKVRNDNVIDMRMKEEKLHRFDGPQLVESRTKYSKETYFASPKLERSDPNGFLVDYPPQHYELSPKISDRSHSTTHDSDNTWNFGRYKIYDIPFETTHFPSSETHPVVGMEALVIKNRRNSDVSRDRFGSSHLKVGDDSTLGSRPESGYASGTGGYLSSLEISLPRSESAWTSTGSPALSSRQSNKTWLASPKSHHSYLPSPKSLEILTPSKEIFETIPRYATPREERKHSRASSILGSPKSLEVISKTLDRLDVVERQKKKDLSRSEMHLRKIPRTQSVQSAIDFLKQRVRETKYVTAVFETRGGIENVIDDVIKEMGVWLGDKSHLLAVACEVHWSVPEQFRSRINEIKLKDALHRVLRNNNKRVLDLYDEVKNILPITFYESKTEENCSRAIELNAFQDEKTIQHHRSYWELKNLHTLDNFPPKPSPESFLYSKKVEQLKSGSIVAVNLATIRMEKNDYDDEDKENQRKDFIQQIIDTNQTAIKASKTPVNVKYVLNIQQVAK